MINSVSKINHKPLETNKTNSTNVNLNKNTTSSAKNTSSKDEFIKKHKKAIITGGSIIAAAGAVTGAYFLAKNGKLGTRLQNFTENLFKKTSANIEESAKIKTNIDKVSNTDANELVQKEEDTLDALTRATERQGQLRTQCMALCGGSGIQGHSRVYNGDPESMEGRLIEIKLKQFIPIWEEYKENYSKAEKLYNQTKLYNEKHAKEFSPEELEERIRLTEVRHERCNELLHEDQEFYDRILTLPAVQSILKANKK